MYKTSSKLFRYALPPEINFEKSHLLHNTYPYKHLTYIPHPDDFESILDPKPELNPLPLVVEFDPVPQPRLAEPVP